MIMCKSFIPCMCIYLNFKVLGRHLKDNYLIFTECLLCVPSIILNSTKTCLLIITGFHEADSSLFRIEVIEAK